MCYIFDYNIKSYFSSEYKIFNLFTKSNLRKNHKYLLLQ